MYDGVFPSAKLAVKNRDAVINLTKSLTVSVRGHGVRHYGRLPGYSRVRP
jgi:hypothetical protein